MIEEVIARVLCVDVEQVVPKARLGEDLGADSLDYVDLAIELEAAEKIGEIPDDEVLKWETVQDVIDSVNRAKA